MSIVPRPLPKFHGRIGLVYILSAFVGSLTAALFIKNNPVVTSSGALFGLLGAMLSVLIRNWKVYSDKALLTLEFLCSHALVLFV
ncbi:hypothetical protein IFM89_020329 [Coptis chinensis]|uniref:RHOMBOID-like protein n=1 Tax=Coptis chinensis TaxID=261450 RepID=A0A835H6R3_9MAGN|nr:hypothetical protein IFM89_020329 [Coptis chinensis]